MISTYHKEAQLRNGLDLYYLSRLLDKALKQQYITDKNLLYEVKAIELLVEDLIAQR